MVSSCTTPTSMAPSVRSEDHGAMTGLDAVESPRHSIVLTLGLCHPRSLRHSLCLCCILNTRLPPYLIPSYRSTPIQSLIFVCCVLHSAFCFLAYFLSLGLSCRPSSFVASSISLSAAPCSFAAVTDRFSLKKCVPLRVMEH